VSITLVPLRPITTEKSKIRLSVVFWKYLRETCDHSHLPGKNCEIGKEVPNPPFTNYWSVILIHDCHATRIQREESGRFK